MSQKSLIILVFCKMVRIAGLEPARITPLPPQSSASANSAICADVRYSEETHHFRGGLRSKIPVLTSVLTGPKKKRGGKRFQRVGHGLFRFKTNGDDLRCIQGQRTDTVEIAFN